MSNLDFGGPNGLFNAYKDSLDPPKSAKIQAEPDFLAATLKEINSTITHLRVLRDRLEDYLDAKNEV